MLEAGRQGGLSPGPTGDLQELHPFDEKERERENKELEVQQEILTKTKLKKVSGLYSNCKLLFYDVDEIN